MGRLGLRSSTISLTAQECRELFDLQNKVGDGGADVLPQGTGKRDGGGIAQSQKDLTLGDSYALQSLDRLDVETLYNSDLELREATTSEAVIEQQSKRVSRPTECVTGGDAS